jgi:hypothetical protein
MHKARQSAPKTHASLISRLGLFPFLCLGRSTKGFRASSLRVAPARTQSTPCIEYQAFLSIALVDNLLGFNTFKLSLFSNLW